VVKRKKSKKEAESKLSFNDLKSVRNILGVHDENVDLLETLFNVIVIVKGGEFKIRGDKGDIDRVKRIISQLFDLAQGGYPLSLREVEQVAKFVDSKNGDKISDVLKYSISVPDRSKNISPKSPAQREYVEAIKSHDMIFGIGPAGTGKTYLAMAMAIHSLMNREYERVILARPAVEAGERLGFLPGNMEEKVNPYLRPLYDALHDMMDFDQAHRYIETGVIEVAPLAFMRGRTLNSSFVILDEAQNCTTEQMKMFLTRMGFDSKYVVTGDITQIDLPMHSRSGLLEVVRILKKVEGIHFQYFTDVDVVRHRLVQDIVRAYERNGVRREKKN